MIKYKELNEKNKSGHNYKKIMKMINRTITTTTKNTTILKNQNNKMQFIQNFKNLINFNLIYLNQLIKNYLILFLISFILIIQTNSICYGVSGYKYNSTTPTFIKNLNLDNNTQPKITKLNIVTSLNDTNYHQNKINNCTSINCKSSSSSSSSFDILKSEPNQFYVFSTNPDNNNDNNNILDNKPFKPSAYFNTIEKYENYSTTDKQNENIVQHDQGKEEWKQWQKQQQQPQQKQYQKSKFKLNTGNELWDSLITECYTHPTFSCLQKNVFTYLDKTLDISNINVTNHLLFIKNKVDYKKYTREANQPYYKKQNIQQQQQQQQQQQSEPNLQTKEVKSFSEKNNRNTNDNNVNNDDNNMNNDNKNHKNYNDLNDIDHNNEYDYDESENEIPDEARAAESPIEEVTNALYDKSIKFAMTHDIELKMPEMMFNGATFRVSPRSIEGNGAIVKLELIPKQEIELRQTGRIFKKKIQNFLKNKLLLSFIAIVLIIKLIKIKLFWLLPLVIGIGAAKKLLLKVLLFFFPALAHIFKLCHYYHNNYHQTKYYHHHHLINHHHSTPVWSNEYSVTLPNGPELIFTQPPKSVPHHEYGPPPVGEHYDNWDASGPGLGSEYLADNIHRNGQADGANYFKPKLEDEDDIKSWGLFNSLSGTTIPPPTSQSYKMNPFITKQHQSIINQKLRGAGIINGGNPLYVTPFKRVHHISTHKTVPPQPSPINLVTAPIPNAAHIAAQYDPALHQHAVHRAQAKVKEALRIQNEHRLIAQQQKILNEEPFAQDGQPILPKGYDPFYTPILEKMDKIFKQMGNNFDTDYCKERLVCSMYKNPNRYSPHSNFISAELSRDPTELEKPSDMNPAVIKFYRLVQAARDGQEQRDCLRLHPQCSVNTE